MRHHFVPQFLLREWAETQPDKKVETFRLDRPEFPSSRRAPKHTGYEENLYALTAPMVAGMEQQAVERHLLRRVDDLAAVVLRKLKAGADLTVDDRCDWVRFLMSLRVRQPKLVQQLRLESSEHLEAALAAEPREYDALAGADDPPTLLEWTKEKYPNLIENVGMSFFVSFIENEKLGRKMLRMKWQLWDFDRERNYLLLADQPCVFTGNIDDPSLIIALPIGPRKAFIASTSDRVASILRQQRPKDLLTHLNESSLFQAQVRVYALDAKPRRFICNRLSKRKRIDQDGRARGGALE